MRIDRIPHRIWNYTKKFTYFGKTSAPYVSPDTFKRIADLDLDRNFYPGSEKIKDASVVFINSGDTEKFFNEYGKIINAKVLIFGNNDVDFTKFEFTIPKSVKKIYLQNSTIDDPLFGTIPIGIESLKYVTNGLPKLFSPEYSSRVKNNRILVGPFGNTHLDRQILLNQQERNFRNVDFIYGRLSPLEYAETSSNYSVVACPRGNGLDTHRFWEALYRGAMPLVVESPWTNYWSRKGVPVIEIPNWEYDLDQILLSESLNLVFNPNESDFIWEPYWYTEIRQGF